ncbi:MAG: hypothetical protein KGS28_05405 [Betaproteobacteria bacterium]|nr:hypothetical protein [Betaproteobacteria bacterium]
MAALAIPLLEAAVAALGGWLLRAVAVIAGAGAGVVAQMNSPDCFHCSMKVVHRAWNWQCWSSNSGRSRSEVASASGAAWSPQGRVPRWPAMSGRPSS